MALSSCTSGYFEVKWGHTFPVMFEVISVLSICLASKGLARYKDANLVKDTDWCLIWFMSNRKQAMQSWQVYAKLRKHQKEHVSNREFDKSD